MIRLRISLFNKIYRYICIINSIKEYSSTFSNKYKIDIDSMERQSYPKSTAEEGRT